MYIHVYIYICVHVYHEYVEVLQIALWVSGQPRSLSDLSWLELSLLRL